MQSRRDLLMGMGVVGLAAATPSFLSAAERHEDAGDPNGKAYGKWQRNRFSGAVADGVFSAFSALMASNASDRARVEVATHAWKVAQDHFNEIGLTSATDQLLLDMNIDEVLNATQLILPQAVDTATKHGAAIRLDDLVARSMLTRERAAAATAYMQEVGCASVFSRVAELVASAPRGRRGDAAAGIAGGGVTTLIDNNCPALAMLVDAMWLLSGLWAAGCYATAGACVPCCAAAIAFTIVAGALGMVYDYYCY